VTVDPSTDGVSGRVQAGTSSSHGSDLGYNFRAAINLPLGDTWAYEPARSPREDPDI